MKAQTHTSSRAMPPLPKTITRRAIASRHFMACGIHTKRHMVSNEVLQEHLQLSSCKPPPGGAQGAMSISLNELFVAHDQ